jgi:hypothetical protein
MTSPTQATTATFSLPYQPVGAPMYEYRQVAENLAKAVDTALASRAVSPPGASDLLAVATRVNALEADQAAEDTARAPATVTMAANFAQFTTAPYGELLRAWKPNPAEARVSGLAIYTGTGLVASSTAVNVLTLPAGYRPDVQLLRSCWQQSGASPPNWHRVQVTTAGVVQVVFGSALATNQFVQFDFGFRLVNAA